MINEPSRPLRRGLRGLATALGLALSLGTAWAGVNPNMPGAAGDLFYVAYQNTPAGTEYIVNLGKVQDLLTATHQVDFPNVSAGDLDGVLGGTAPNIFVSLFGVSNVNTLDGVYSANGARDLSQLQDSNIIGGVVQVNTWGKGLARANDLPVPSANPYACAFSGRVEGSYQAVLNGYPDSPGSLANNVTWNVETRLSDRNGNRISNPKRIQMYVSEKNPYTNLKNRRLVGFFTLHSNGVVTFDPDTDGDFIPDYRDNCPGLANPDQVDADGDGHGRACDCNDGLRSVWALPGEVSDLRFKDPETLVWTIPADSGGTASLLFDLFRGTRDNTGVPIFNCFQPTLSTTDASDADKPVNGQVFDYLVRARNACGGGSVGAGSSGAPARMVPPCP